MAFEMDAIILGGDPIKSELYDTKDDDTERKDCYALFKS